MTHLQAGYYQPYMTPGYYPELSGLGFLPGTNWYDMLYILGYAGAVSYASEPGRLWADGLNPLGIEDQTTRMAVHGLGAALFAYLMLPYLPFPYSQRRYNYLAALPVEPI